MYRDGYGCKRRALNAKFALLRLSAQPIALSSKTIGVCTGQSGRCAKRADEFPFGVLTRLPHSCQQPD